MAEGPFVTDEARALIGKETSEVRYEVSKQDIQKMALAIGDLNPLYLDEEIARSSRYGGIIAHPLQYAAIHELMPESELMDDGMESGRHPPMEFSGVVFGGMETEFFTPIRPGDIITAKRKIVDIAEKKSSKGDWIAILTRETTCTNQKGEVVLVTRETFVYS